VRVLIVEDEPKLAAYVERGLSAEGFVVDVAVDGEDGLWRAVSNRYDAIVLDIMLPKMNGYRVCAAIREQGIWTPILMLTAKDGEMDEAEALDTGADDFLSKPFSFVVLVARIRALMRRSPAERPVVMEAGPIRIDPASRSCVVAGQPIALTTTEFCVLREIVARRGAVVSKAEILASCWDWAFEGDPNIVEVYVARLRRKLEPLCDEAPIATIRGAGYRVAASG
jgi:DNA-binding response OmpR family regulator